MFWDFPETETILMFKQDLVGFFLLRAIIRPFSMLMFDSNAVIGGPQALVTSSQNLRRSLGARTSFGHEDCPSIKYNRSDRYVISFLLWILNCKRSYNYLANF